MAGFKIRNDIGATVFAVLSGFSALFFTVWIFSASGCSGPEKEATINPVPITAGELTALEAELASAKASLEAESSRRSEMAMNLRESRQAAATLEAEKTKWNAAKQELASELESLEGRLSALATEKQTLTAQLAEASNSDAAALKIEVAGLKEELDSEREACRAAKSALNAEIDKLQTGLDQALYGDQLKPAAGDFPALTLPFLVNEPIKLDRKVRPVFIELRGMGESEADLQKAYEKISRDGKTRAIHKVPFESGSAEVVAAETAKLKELLKESSKGAKFLVVGYASTDGDPKSNHELSSKRASSVAAKLAGIEGVDKDSVQAVYFGQTKRFSSSDMAPNRIVEVWQVK